MFKPTSLIAAHALAIAAAGAASAQAAPTSLPVALVSALINDQSPTKAAPDYAVGKLPPGYPAMLVPSGPVRIVGGMRTGYEIVAIFSDSTRRLAAVFEQLFEQKGYTRPAPSAQAGFSNASGPSWGFCGDSGTVSAEPLLAPDHSFVRVTFQRRSGAATCRQADPPPSPTPATPHQLKLPALQPPAGAYVARSSGGGGDTQVDASAEVTGSALEPWKILEHYAGQLAAAGWTSALPAVSDRVAAQFFEAKDTSGTPWEGVLMAAGGKTALTVSLSMRPRSRP